MLNDRKKAILEAIIKEHIRKAEPVSSSLVVDKYGFQLSSATIRNEMHALEKEKYIYQPHISAGRVPSEKGWRYYLDHFLKEKALSQKEKATLEKIVRKHRKSYEDLLKQLAQALAYLSRETAIVGFAPHDVYYTGLSHLFQQPEFQESNLICDISEVVDHLDVVMAKVFKQISKKIKILIGRENPFGHKCGVILARYKYPGHDAGMFGILGPIRQAYDFNLSLLKYSQTLINNL